MSAETVAAVVTSGVVGLAGVTVPALIRRDDRRHARAENLRERRTEAYTEMLRLMQDIQGMRTQAVHVRADEVSVLLWLWGTRRVRELFFVWMQAWPTRFGPEATEEARQRVHEAAIAVREAMALEVQSGAVTRTVGLRGADKTVKRRRSPRPREEV